ncbi:hypothetical protein Sjap_021340 [Stephania japonica]|uniref:Target of Myb protein 1 n=1 Tax=Stephania japonica TaxID=461633 RepID=A0AAP0ETZ5_9MAGN
MAAALVNLATSEKLKEMDWTKNIEICEIVARDPREARDTIKAIKKRLGSKHPNSQLLAVSLLEMLMNNCGEHIHGQVIDSGLLPLLVKIVKKKSDLPVREKIFLLLDATQTSLGGASGKFPQYYAAYYELVSAGVKFSQDPRVPPIEITTSKSHENGSFVHSIPARSENNTHQSNSDTVPESSIIQKASAALEVLRDVLDAIDPRHPEDAKDEFTLDLVEQCSFQKQRVMHLVLTSRDEKVVSRAIELNEQLQNVLTRHDSLLSVRSTSIAAHLQHDEAEEEEAERLFRRISKGKACVRAEDEDLPERPIGLLESIQAERMNRPLIRPLPTEQMDHRLPSAVTLPTEQKDNRLPSAVLIPPPPSKRQEREKFFQEKHGDGLEGNMRHLTLHSRNASSSNSGSIDSSE